ncbi:MAG: flagellar basal body P-ring protein FlgI [Candidatus Sericytochromatia bacterium]|nr:flagellar basal body P-ring protein FlgI [Candidatus Sericytochromatia bacterium]
MIPVVAAAALLIGNILPGFAAEGIRLQDIRVRVKDVANVRGARINQLVGYGIVVGLNGTGDSQRAFFTNKALANALERLGMGNLPALNVKNVAGVLVTASLPPFFKQGQQVDVTISSIGDSKSLQGGVLVRTPLRGPDNRTYLVAQGSVSIGGFGVEANGSSVQKNSTTVGRIPNGGIVEAEVPVTLMDENNYLYYSLINPDFSTASELETKVNKSLLGNATAMDAATVRVYVPAAYRTNIVDLIARIENLTLSPAAQPAKVVLEERTGTLIVGQNVRIGPVAVTHGGLIVRIDTTNNVSQPGPLSNGTTTKTSESTITVDEKKGETVNFESGTTVGQLVKALNGLGVPSRDLITILQNIKSSGALNAHLEIL